MSFKTRRVSSASSCLPRFSKTFWGQKSQVARRIRDNTIIKDNKHHTSREVSAALLEEKGGDLSEEVKRRVRSVEASGKE